MARLIGYARVSPGRAGPAAATGRIEQGRMRGDSFTDKASGARASRPGLDACIEALEPGDTLVVWRLDRLGRSMPHLVRPGGRTARQGHRLPFASGRRH